MITNNLELRFLFFCRRNVMKKGLLILFVLFLTGSELFAQYYHVGRYGGRLYLDDTKLTEQETRVLLADVQGFDLSKDWDNARNAYITGEIFQVSGGLCTLGCVIGMYYADGKGFSSLINPEKGMGKATLGLLIGAGFGLLIKGIGDAKVMDGIDQLRMISRWLNESESRGKTGRISFGPTESGIIGVTFSF